MTEEQIKLYASWIVGWIKAGTINIKTGKAFTIDDIKNTNVKAEVIVEFKAEVVAGIITAEQYKTYAGMDYVA